MRDRCALSNTGFSLCVVGWNKPHRLKPVLLGTAVSGEGSGAVSSLPTGSGVLEPRGASNKFGADLFSEEFMGHVTTRVN